MINSVPWPSLCQCLLWDLRELWAVHTKGFGKELLVNRGRIRVGHIFCTSPNTNCRNLWLSLISQCLQEWWHLFSVSTSGGWAEVIEMWTSCLRWSDHSPDDLQPEEQDQAVPGIILSYKGSNTWRPGHNSPFLVQKSCQWQQAEAACNPLLYAFPAVKLHLAGSGGSQRQNLSTPAQRMCPSITCFVWLTRERKKGSSIIQLNFLLL